MRPRIRCILALALTVMALAGGALSSALAATGTLYVQTAMGALPANSNLPAGYAYAQRVTVTGGSVAVPGSTVTPVPSNGTDYVLMLHLTGDQAAAIYNGAAYNATHTLGGVPFADVTLWWTDGGGAQHQIDVDTDTDTDTYGAWSANNITLWFKLQQPLAAAPATDSSYTLAWGNSNPTVMRDWGNIYPFQDDFTSSSLDITK